MTRTRILASTLALVAFGGLTACDPEQVVEDVLTLDVIRHTISDAGIHHPVLDDPATPAVEGDESQPPIDSGCCNPDAVTVIAPEDVPEPVQSGWTWDRASYTVTNHDVSGGVRVQAKHGPFETPLISSTMLAPGQSVTIPAAPCGSPVRLIIDGFMFQSFVFC